MTGDTGNYNFLSMPWRQKYVKATIIPNEMKVLIESGSQTKKSQRDKWKYELHSVTPRTKVPPSLHCHSQGGNNEVRVLVASGTSVVGQATVERLVEHAGMSVWLTWRRTLRYSVRIIISYVTYPFNNLRGSVQGYHLAFHLAAVPNTTYGSRPELFQINVLGTY